MPFLFETVSNVSEKIRLSNVSLKFIIYISIEPRIRNSLLQKFLQTDMILFYQFIVYLVKYGNHLAEFIIPITLF